MSQTLQQPSTLPPPSNSPSSTVSPESPLPREVDEPETVTLPSRVRAVFATIIGWIPSVVVIVGLGGLAWYGHHNDWKLPSAQSLTGESVAATGPAWCESHGVPEKDCIVCTPGLIENSAKLTFCNQHGVHGCPLCNPELAETKSTYTATENELKRVENALALQRRKENSPVSSSPGTRIQFASLDAIEKAGVDVEPVVRDRVVESIDAAGEIRYDETKSALVSPQADGVVRKIFVNIGDWVDAGDVLMLLDSSEAGRLKTQLVAAISDEQLSHKTVERIRPLAGGAVAGKRLLESEAELLQAAADVDRIAGLLANLGIRIDVDRIRKLDGKQLDDAIKQSSLKGIKREALPSDVNLSNLIVVSAPLAGQIVSRSTTIGEVVDRGSEIFRIVDTRTVWLDLRVPAEDASLVSIGQKTLFRPDGASELHEGTVSWISTETDTQTRTVRVRAELANDDQRLRHETFGRGEVVLRDDSEAILVPESAVQWDGTGYLVFVRDARFFEEDRPKFFVARSVRPGVESEGMVEILAGVVPGEVVASSGGDVLRAQLLRSNLGAGCTCGH
ncbi:Cobalt-zinc-cadmium resistance protein CzcB [Thalassoglobus neptunius]|uniref:Cobalt-zinc-cadmium resistance protein CzcB n=1 Tax=Thalassoglobus neptunius TaxID=1938619 RepID=A0A5C5WNM4_9PLAN|nr:efflux RND transporter periplasmic adaptor subunit [Thalassoglobus neptunius]TWT51721.1 Cobalt-zinc-cadmium resistance protein CzcB [Thalassoglobus neptunius]